MHAKFMGWSYLGNQLHAVVEMLPNGKSDKDPNRALPQRAWHYHSVGPDTQVLSHTVDQEEHLSFIKAEAQYALDILKEVEFGMEVALPRSSLRAIIRRADIALGNIKPSED